MKRVVVYAGGEAAEIEISEDTALLNEPQLRQWMRKRKITGIMPEDVKLKEKVDETSKHQSDSSSHGE